MPLSSLEVSKNFLIKQINFFFLNTERFTVKHDSKGIVINLIARELSCQGSNLEEKI